MMTDAEWNEYNRIDAIVDRAFDIARKSRTCTKTWAYAMALVCSGMAIKSDIARSAIGNKAADRQMIDNLAERDQYINQAKQAKKGAWG